MTYSHSEDGAAGMPPLYIMQQCDRRSTVVSIPEWIFLQYNSMSDSFVYPHCRTATPTQRECSWLPPVGFQTYLNLRQHLSLWLGLFLCIFFLSLVGHVYLPNLHECDLAHAVRRPSPQLTPRLREPFRRGRGRGRLSHRRHPHICAFAAVDAPTAGETATGDGERRATGDGDLDVGGMMDADARPRPPRGLSLELFCV